MLRVVLPWMIGRAFEKIGDQMGLLVQDRAAADVPQLRPDRQDLGGADSLRTPARTRGPTVSHIPAARGAGLLNAGPCAIRSCVPSYTVMFAFFLVLTVGWLFVAERRQGTLKRLRAAPLSRSQILLGKLLPCFLLSLFQGLFLLAAGKLIFGMSWGAQPWWLVLVVVTTSLSAMGLALLVAAWPAPKRRWRSTARCWCWCWPAVSGCLMGDRELMPERCSESAWSRRTPGRWWPTSNCWPTRRAERRLVLQSCAVLTGFGVGFLGPGVVLFAAGRSVLKVCRQKRFRLDRATRRQLV